MSQRGDALKQEIARRGSVLASVRGDSMHPVIKRGEVVRLAPVKRLRRGMVVAFEDDHGGLLIHRIVRMTGDAVVCRGDNRCDPDPPVSRAAVAAVAVAARQPPDGPWRPVRWSLIASFRAPLRRFAARIRWHVRRLTGRLGRSSP